MIIFPIFVLKANSTISPPGPASATGVSNNCNANTTSTQLESTITEIRAVADAVKGASRNINKGNTDLKQRTEQAASNLQDTAANMAEMTEVAKGLEPMTDKAKSRLDRALSKLTSPLGFGMDKVKQERDELLSSVWRG